MGRPIPSWLDTPLPSEPEVDPPETQSPPETTPLSPSSSSPSLLPPPTASLSSVIRQRLASAVEAESNRANGRPNLFLPAEPGERSRELRRRVQMVQSRLALAASSSRERILEHAERRREAEERMREAVTLPRTDLDEEAVREREQDEGVRDDGANNGNTNRSSIALISAAGNNESIHGTTIFVAPSFHLTVTSRAGPSSDGGNEDTTEAAGLAISLSTSSPNTPDPFSPQDNQLSQDSTFSPARRAMGLLNDVLSQSSGNSSSTATIAIADGNPNPPPTLTTREAEPRTLSADSQPFHPQPSHETTSLPSDSFSSSASGTPTLATLERQRRGLLSSLSDRSSLGGLGTRDAESESMLRSAGEAITTAIEFAERLEEATRNLSERGTAATSTSPPSPTTTPASPPSPNNEISTQTSSTTVPPPSDQNSTLSAATRSLQRSINQLRLASARVDQLLGEASRDLSLYESRESLSASAATTNTNSNIFEQSREFRARERARRRLQSFANDLDYPVNSTSSPSPSSIFNRPPLGTIPLRISRSIGDRGRLERTYPAPSRGVGGLAGTEAQTQTRGVGGGGLTLEGPAHERLMLLSAEIRRRRLAEEEAAQLASLSREGRRRRGWTSRLPRVDKNGDVVEDEEDEEGLIGRKGTIQIGR